MIWNKESDVLKFDFSKEALGLNLLPRRLL